MQFAPGVTTALKALAPGQPVQLLPFGEFAAVDGRPAPGKKWRLSDAQGAALAARVNARLAANRMVIDYEHQTLLAARNGQPAPAAGWVQAVEWRPGQGLFGTVEWTAAARARIDAGEYMYLSPVMGYDEETFDVVDLQMAAITNNPGLQGMQAVLTALAATAAHAPSAPALTHPRQEPPMLLASLIAALGLPNDATEQTALTALAALRAKPVVPTELLAELSLPAGTAAEAALSAIRVLKSGSGSDAAAVARLTAQVEQLQREASERQLSELVDGAIAVHKFVAADREHLLTIGRASLTALTSYINGKAPIAGLAGQAKPGGAEGDNKPGTAALTAQQRSLCAALGISEERYAKQLAAEAA
jgi:phage I-like protein